jgi:hypothetical protein
MRRAAKPGGRRRADEGAGHRRLPVQPWWQGDVPAAVDGTPLDRDDGRVHAGIEKVTAARANCRPLLIGIHW